MKNFEEGFLFSVAIDGPAGAGKSSVARAVASELGVCYFDTGALYRTVGFFLLQNGVDLKREDEIEKRLENCDLEVFCKDKEQKIFLNGKKIGEEIRTSEISSAASFVSKNFFVRKFLLKTQRDFAKKNSVIMDGRDIGTVVLKNANLKIFLTASLKVRVLRRYKEFVGKGIFTSIEEVLKEIENRDYNDKTRKFAPLKMAKDAILIDNSEISFEESVERVVSLVKKHILEEQVEFI